MWCVPSPTGSRIIPTLLIPEALGPLILGYTFVFVAVVDMTAVAGAIGGGGLGNFAIVYGYQRFNWAVTWVAVGRGAHHHRPGPGRAVPRQLAGPQGFAAIGPSNSVSRNSGEIAPFPATMRLQFPCRLPTVPREER